MSDDSILPVVRYKDPAAAADWLCGAFGFGSHHVAQRPDGGVAYIVLRFGDNFMLVGPPDSSVFDDLMVQPADVGNRSTQTCYLTVKNVEQHYANACAAGARIEVEPCDDDGERFYMCSDPEGHLWGFGRPLAGATLSKPAQPSVAPRQYAAGRGQAAIGLAILVGLAVGIGTVFYAGADFAPKALASWIGGIAGQDATRDPHGRERLTAFAERRLAEAEAVAADLTEKLQASWLQFAETLRQKERAEQQLLASETEYQKRLKDSDGILDAALRVKESVSQELEAENQRVRALQKRLDDASERLAGMRADASKVNAEAQQLRAAMAQLSDSLRSSAQSAEFARGRLAVAEDTEKGLLEKLHASELETAELRTRVTELEREKEAARLKADRAAEAAAAAVAVAQANQSALRDKFPVPEGEILSHHHLALGKKWITVAAVELGKPEISAATKPLESEASPCGQAARDLVLHRHDTGTGKQVISRLCGGAHATQEPAKCVSRLLSGKVNWGGGTDWDLKNAVDLCARTPSAAATLSCFSRQIVAKAGWASAIAACSAS